MTLDLFPELNVITFPRKRAARRLRPLVGGDVTPFPLARRTQVVQTIAAGLECREGRIRDEFWYAAVEALRDQLAAATIPEAAILREIRSFRSAVQFAIDFQRFGGAPSGRDGAA